MIGRLDFLWDLNTFPIDDELINNFRTRTPAAGASRTDLETHQLRPGRLIYRTNAYGGSRRIGARYAPDAGFPSEEFGGAWRQRRPSRRCTEENRYIGKANLDWQADRYNRLAWRRVHPIQHRSYVHRAHQRVLPRRVQREAVALERLRGGPARPRRRGRRGRHPVRLVRQPGFAAGGLSRSSRPCRNFDPDDPTAQTLWCGTRATTM